MPLARAETSALVSIDVQERLAPAMAPGIRREALAGIEVLLRAAGELAVPVVATEQYPKGLGETLPEVREWMPGSATTVVKESFSCCDEAAFTDAIGAAGRSQLVLVGMEAHVCVLQTAVQLREAGYTVVVAADAVCSRSTENKTNALERLRMEGVVVASVESVLFEWLRRAGTDAFRSLSKLIR